MKGRKPTPTHLRVLAGNPQHRPINNDEPFAPGELLAPPDWLTNAQKEVWRREIANAPKGLLREADRELFTAWVIAADVRRDAAEKLARFGSVVKSPNAGLPIQSPYLPILNKQAEIMSRIASELGFSPTSRSRLKVGAPATKENRFANNAARRNGAA